MPISEELYKRAFNFYKKRQDKEWGLTDCISFVVMQDYALNKALAADEHFKGGHGFNIIKDTKMIEVKQGPYLRMVYSLYRQNIIRYL